MPSSTADYSNCVGGALNDGDVAFMMFASTVVMLQTPAMGLAQAGMIRRKNSLSMLMQTLSGMVIGSMLWFFVGYSLTFGTSVGGIIGGFEHAFLLDVPYANCLDSAPTIPAFLYVAFQMMFALMVPVIVTGAWSEKMTFEAFLIFVTIWPFLVYYPLAHWVWNIDGWLAKMGVVDFAGGLTIHTSSGMAALIIAYLMERRGHNVHLGHHNLPMTVMGAALIWAGWYSFNGGSAQAANSQAAIALVNTHLAACIGGSVWTLGRYLKDGHWHVTDIMNGAFCGLASITPGSGVVEPWAAVFIGLTGSLCAFFTVDLIKERMKLDDVLDVSSLQGIPGMWGSLMVGLFACPAVQPDPTSASVGLFYGGGSHLLGVQTLAVFVCAGWSLALTWVVVYAMKHTVGIDVSPEVEEMGLDLAQMGEQAYDEKLAPLLDLGKDMLTQKLCEAAASGDITEVNNLIRAGADCIAGDYDKRTPLHLAAAGGHLTLMKHMVSHNVEIKINATDVNGTTPLYDALMGGHVGCVEWLVERKAELGTSSIAVQQKFFAACSDNNVDLVDLIILAKMDVNVADYDMRTPLMLASCEGHTDVVKTLLGARANLAMTDRWNATALSNAMDFNHQAVVNIFLRSADDSSDSTSTEAKDTTALLASDSLSKQQGTINARRTKNEFDQLNTKRQTFKATSRELCKAAAEGDTEDVKRLLNKGADPNGCDYDSRTALHLAVESKQLSVVKLLIKQRNIQVNALDRWRKTPYECACENEFHDIAMVLRKHGASMINSELGVRLCQLAADNNLEKLQKVITTAGADPNVADYDSRTALHLAACNGYTTVVRFLLQSGAKAAVHDRFGNTPLDDAIRHQHSAVVRILQAADTLSGEVAPEKQAAEKAPEKAADAEKADEAASFQE